MSKRPAMIATVIRDMIAPVLRNCPPECGVVAITGVEVSPDGGYATATVSALLEPAAALRYLEGELPALQRRLGVLAIRKIPRLRFRLDKQIERENRLDDLLRGT